MSGPLWLILGLAGGALAAWLALRGRLAERSALAARAAEAQVELAGERARLEAQRSTTDELERAQAALATQFEALAGKALQTSNESFLQLARAQLEQLQATGKSDLETRQKAVEGMVKPLAEALGRMDTQLSQSQGRLQQQLADLGRRTETLTNALRAPAERGRWGEMQLERALEFSGLVRDVHFETQVSVRTDDGLQRPDFVVRLPGGKCVVIDAKVPFDAYYAALETDDPAVRAEKLREHARLVRDHVTKLGSKAYQRSFTTAPDFVFMFLPDEGFFRVAEEQDPTLFTTALDAKVHCVSPRMLISVLQTIAAVWQQESIAESAREVHELGRDLHDRLATMAGHFDKMGRSLRSSVEAYNQGIGSLESRVLVTARRLEQYDVAAKPLPKLQPVDVVPRPVQALEPPAESLGVAGADAA